MVINAATNLKIVVIVATLLGAVFASIPAAHAQRDRRITLEDDRGYEVGSGRIRDNGRVSIDLDRGGELTGRIRSNGRMVLEDEEGREYEFRCRSNGRCERDD